MGLTLFFSKGLDTDIMLKPDVCTISSMKHGQALHLLVLCLHEEKALRGIDLYWISQEKNSPHPSLHLGTGEALCETCSWYQYKRKKLHDWKPHAPLFSKVVQNVVYCIILHKGL